MNPTLPHLFLLLFALVSCHTGKHEIIVTPRGFTGPVFVVFDQRTGLPAQYMGYSHLYQVPTSGVLHTQFAPNAGWVGVPQFYQGAVAVVNRLPTRLLLGRVPPDTVVGFMGATGSVRLGAETEERLRWQEFFIGNRDMVKQAQAQVDTLNVLRFLKQGCP